MSFCRFSSSLSLIVVSSVDLSQAWAPYKAASTALQNTVAVDNVKRLAALHWAAVPRCLEATRVIYITTTTILLDSILIVFFFSLVAQRYLTEGVLVDEYVLDHINPLLDAVRDCNVTLRWLMLQRHAQPKLAAIIADVRLSLFSSLLARLVDRFLFFRPDELLLASWRRATRATRRWRCLRCCSRAPSSNTR